jgi:hypothetical protein
MIVFASRAYPTWESLIQDSIGEGWRTFLHAVGTGHPDGAPACLAVGYRRDP